MEVDPLRRQHVPRETIWPGTLINALIIESFGVGGLLPRRRAILPGHRPLDRLGRPKHHDHQVTNEGKEYVLYEVGAEDKW